MRRFWKGIAIFFLGGVLGTGFGVALGFFSSRSCFRRRPPWINSPRPMSRRASATGSRRRRDARVATAFIHANPSDPVHWGRGKVSVYERTVFRERLRGGAGPAYHVYFVPKAACARKTM